MKTLTVAIVGASGRTGRGVIRALQARGVHVRAVSRQAGKPGLFAPDVAVQSAELGSVGSLQAAFEGVDSIHYIPPVFNPHEEEYGANLIAAAEAAGVDRVIYHSVMHSATPDMPHHARKARVELLLRHSSLAWTVLQPAMYAQTALAFFDKASGALTPPFSVSRLFTPVHLGDLSEAAAIVHTAEGHAFATYELAGPERLSFMDIGERLSSLLGRQTTTHAVPPQMLAAGVSEVFGFNPDQSAEMKLMFDHYDNHGFAGSGNVLRMIVGREPTCFTDAVKPIIIEPQPRPDLDGSTHLHPDQDLNAGKKDGCDVLSP